MDSVFENRLFPLFAVMLLAAVIIISYSNTFSSSFQFDDTQQIVENRQIRSLANLPGILRGQRGVTVATFAFNYAMGGLNTWGWHVVNTAIHIANSALVMFFISSALFASGMGAAISKRLSFFVALIFALHPVQTQAVTYIVQRMESLSALFYLLALILFIKSGQTQAQFKRYLLYAVTALSYVLAFYSKESALTLPAAILLYDFYFLSALRFKPLLARWPMHAMLWVLFIFFSLTTVMPSAGFSDYRAETAAQEASVKIAPAGAKAAQNAPSPAASPDVIQKTADLPTAGFALPNFTPKQYLYTQFNVTVYYLSLLIAPANQNLDYDFPLSNGLFETPAINKGTLLNYPLPPPAVSLVILALIAAIAFYLAFWSLRNGPGRARVSSFFIFWFFLILSPTSSFIPILDVIYEHRLYLASAGAFTCFIIGVDALLSFALRSGRGPAQK